MGEEVEKEIPVSQSPTHFVPILGSKDTADELVTQKDQKAL